MVTILVNLLVGWLLTFVGLDKFLTHFLGFETRTYYLVWFAMGFIVWVRNVFRR
jgi:hypothetical protein